MNVHRAELRQLDLTDVGNQTQRHDFGISFVGFGGRLGLHMLKPSVQIQEPYSRMLLLILKRVRFGGRVKPNFLQALKPKLNMKLGLKEKKK